MHAVRRFLWVIFSILILAAIPQSIGRASTPGPVIPEGFELIDSAVGVQLYRKNYAQGNPDYVQIVDLQQGAGVELLHGPMEGAGTGKGIYGGDSPKFMRRSIKQFWNMFSGEEPNAFCVTNGQFFLLADNPSAISHPLKKDGVVLSEGFGYDHYVDADLMLEIWDDRVFMRSLSKEALYTSTAPDILGGLTEEANKRAKKSVGRTYLGIDDPDQDGVSEILLVYNTVTALQTEAAQMLRNFGADQVMMLDGGGSAQLTCRGDPIIDTDRYIPQALGIHAGPAVSLSGAAASGMAQALSLSSPAAAAAALDGADEENWPTPFPTPQATPTPQTEPESPEAMQAVEPTVEAVEAEPPTPTTEAVAPTAAPAVPVDANGDDPGAPAAAVEAAPAVQAAAPPAEPAPAGQGNEAGAMEAALANPALAPESKSAAAQTGAKAVLAEGAPAMAGAVVIPKESMVNLGDIIWIPALAIPIGLFLVFTIKHQQNSLAMRTGSRRRY